MCGATASGPTEPSRITEPSAGAVATYWCARLPPAPARLSMTTLCLRLSATFFAMMRAAVSAPPPATKPTTSVIVFWGRSCAAASVVASARAMKEEKRFIEPPAAAAMGRSVPKEAPLVGTDRGAWLRSVARGSTVMSLGANVCKTQDGASYVRRDQARRSRPSGGAPFRPAVAVAQVPATELDKPPANALKFTVLSTSGIHGQSAVWTAADGSQKSRDSIKLRGMAWEVDQSARLGQDGMPVSLVIRGVTPKGDAAETFSVGGGKATWKSPVDEGTAFYSGPALYVSHGGTWSGGSQLFLEALLSSADKSLALLPGGRARAERLTEAVVGDGTSRKSVVAWSITGLEQFPIHALGHVGRKVLWLGRRPCGLARRLRRRAAGSAQGPERRNRCQECGSGQDAPSRPERPRGVHACACLRARRSLRAGSHRLGGQGHHRGGGALWLDPCAQWCRGDRWHRQVARSGLVGLSPAHLRRLRRPLPARAGNHVGPRSWQQHSFDDGPRFPTRGAPTAATPRLSVASDRRQGSQYRSTRDGRDVAGRRHRRNPRRESKRLYRRQVLRHLRPCMDPGICGDGSHHRSACPRPRSGRHATERGDQRRLRRAHAHLLRHHGGDAGTMWSRRRTESIASMGPAAMPKTWI